ncbi:uncharacterized protein G2W53_003632 [Senna tora]|uniref:Uncharacterized protein n=1 Tax=Senna tora TaxID=362788 RepID=A0A835CGK4_9FABA|nr:uncharacterized protein G2W53_003632 [Senna tora]
MRRAIEETEVGEPAKRVAATDLSLRPLYCGSIAEVGREESGTSHSHLPLCLQEPSELRRGIVMVGAAELGFPFLAWIFSPHNSYVQYFHNHDWVGHIHIEGNRAADTLAGHAFCGSLDLRILHEAPAFLSSVLRADLDGKGSYRLCMS